MPPARSVREARGIEVRGDEKFTLQPAKPRIGEWATSVQESLAAKMKQGSGK